MPKTILNVGVNPSARSRLLRAAGYRVVEARSPEDALRLAVDGDPSAIVLGRLPHGKVAALCQQLRAARTTSAIPVVHLGGGPAGIGECSADVCVDVEEELAVEEEVDDLSSEPSATD